MITKEYNNLNEKVQEFYDYLKAYILKKVQNEIVAEDILQEVMLKLVESHHKDAEIKNVKAWLFQVSRNTMADYFRNNQLVHDIKDENSLASNGTASLEFSVYDYLIPMIQFLPGKYSKPLLWSDIEKIPQKTIADKLSLSHSAAKMRVQRARKMLRELFVTCCYIEYDANGGFVSCTVKDSCTPLTNHLVDFEKDNCLK